MATDQAEHGPGVPYPPPLIFLAGWALAWVLQWRLSFEIDGAGPGVAQLALALLLASCGTALVVAGIVTFVRARTTMVPNRPARALVMGGPYRFTRNPMYLGLTAIYFGLALAFNLAWPIVLLPLVLAALTLAVIVREEGHLRAAFGDEYEIYCRSVRRWV